MNSSRTERQPAFNAETVCATSPAYVTRREPDSFTASCAFWNRVPECFLAGGSASITRLSIRVSSLDVNFSQSKKGPEMSYYIAFVGAIHVIFAGCEMFPWANPILLRIVAKRLPALAEGHGDSKFSPAQQQIVATIVHNAGIYNAVLAGAFLWTFCRGDSATEFATVLFVGAAVAGMFGTVTLWSVVTAFQAVLGIIGVYWLRKNGSAW